MSRVIGSPIHGRRLVVAIAAAVLVGGGTTAALVLSRSLAQEPSGPCEIAANDAYAERVDRILADYDRILANHEAGQADSRYDAASLAYDVAEYGFTPLFQMQACSVVESDLSGVVSNLGGIPRVLRYVIYDPEFRGLWAAPIDIEVAWYEELGVKGLVGGWSTIARLDHEGVGVVQRLLSLGLAHATNPDRDAVLESGEYVDFVADKDRYLGHAYTDAFTDLGSQTIELARYEPLRWTRSHRGYYLFDEPDDWELLDTGPRVYGWSVLAPLLRFGDFHEQFLTPVATAIVEFDQAHGGDWRIAGEDQASFDAFDDDPTSAMDAVLEALSRNPAAADAVFAATGDQRVQRLLSDG